MAAPNLNNIMTKQKMEAIQIEAFIAEAKDEIAQEEYGQSWKYALENMGSNPKCLPEEIYDKVIKRSIAKAIIHL